MSGIVLEEAGSRGRYVLREDGHEAELTYTRLSPTEVVAERTDVSDALRGRRAGDRLVAHLVEEARAKGFRVIPLCPFVHAWGREHPEAADPIDV